jgi:hypothetical protein
LISDDDLTYTVTKAKRGVGPQHRGDGKCPHPHRTIGHIRHQHRSGRWVYVDDGNFRYPNVVGLRHAWLFLTSEFFLFLLIFFQLSGDGDLTLMTGLKSWEHCCPGLMSSITTWSRMSGNKKFTFHPSFKKYIY